MAVFPSLRIASAGVRAGWLTPLGAFLLPPTQSPVRIARTGLFSCRDAQNHWMQLRTVATNLRLLLGNCQMFFWGFLHLSRRGGRECFGTMMQEANEPEIAFGLLAWVVHVHRVFVRELLPVQHFGVLDELADDESLLSGHVVVGWNWSWVSRSAKNARCFLRSEILRAKNMVTCAFPKFWRKTSSLSEISLSIS